MQGRAIYVREGCWYCHTQQTRTIEADTVRYGWRGVQSPVSTPDEFVYDQPHMFGTRRVGPDLSRVGGKYDRQWHVTHFRDPRGLVPGSVMPPFPWIVAEPGGARRPRGLHPDPGPRRRTGARPTTTSSSDVD